MLPPDAESVVSEVRRAAEKRDYVTLRGRMVSEFTWNFGGDLDADQAIAEWKKDRDVLRKMVKVLSKGCRRSEPTKFECPGAGGTAYRAGFAKTELGWLMEYFVAGD